jgi:hypothetical protein
VEHRCGEDSHVQVSSERAEYGGGDQPFRRRPGSERQRRLCHREGGHGVVFGCGGVLNGNMIDDPLALLSMGVWLFAAGMWPVAFLFGACSPCCQTGDPSDPCQWTLNYRRCLSIGFTGSSPPVGRDRPLTSQQSGSFDNELLSLGEGLIVVRAQSKIRVTIRLSLSASGTSRTPVGETRTQVWRFNRPAPTSPPATAYDIIELGPEWHLQVDLSVTGVATQEEAGVVSTLGGDSEGQPKLILQIKQWTATITHDEVVTLFPTGLQRWGPNVSNTQSFRLTAIAETATLVSGGTHSGWTVSKLAGLTVEERTYALHVFSTPFASIGINANRVYLNEDLVLSFLAGDQMLQVSGAASDGSQASRDLRILPDSLLCGVSAQSMDIGMALGIYPEFCTLSPTESFLGSLPRVGNADRDDPFLDASVYQRWCGGEGVAMRPVPGLSGFISNSLCLRNWQASYARYGVVLTNVSATPSDFFSGETLLWNLEHGPYRTSFLIPVRSSGRPPSIGLLSDDWLVTLGGNGEPSRYDLPDQGCPAGFTGGVVFRGSGTLYFPLCTAIFEATFSTPQGTFTAGANQLISSNHFRDGEYVRLWAGFIVGPGSFSLKSSGPESCEESGELDLELDAINDVNLTFEGPKKIPFVDVNRLTCSNWSLDAIPKEGATVTRTCMIGEGPGNPGVVGFVMNSLQFPPSNSMLPRLVAPDALSPAIIREPACRLLGIRAEGGAFTFVNNAFRTLGNPATRGQCFYHRLIFGTGLPVNQVDFATGLAGGFTTQVGCSGMAYDSFIPCDNCAPSIEVISGDERAKVTYIERGERAGFIEVVVLQDWFGAEGVTFIASCGSEQTTFTIRSPNSAPSVPRNLIATRGPCSNVFLQWQPPEKSGGPAVSSYDVQFRRRENTAFTTFGNFPASSLSATVTGLLRLGYAFRVRARNSVGPGPYTDEVVVDWFTLGAPTDLTFTRDPCSQAQLSWVAPTQSVCVVVANYRLEYRVGISGTFLVFGTVAGTATTGTITGLDPTLQYQFRVARVADAGSDLFSNTVTSGAIATTPFGVAAALGTEPGEVDVTWNVNELLCFENTDYLVQFLSSATPTWSDFTRAASTDKFATVTGLTPARYFFRVRATNSIGNSEFSSPSNSVTIPEPE